MFDEIPSNTFCPIPALLDESSSIHSLLQKSNNPILSTKTTVHHNIFARRKERLAYTNHESNFSSKLLVKLWDHLFRSILPLYNISHPQNQGNPPEYCMALIFKRMWFPPNTHESRGGLIIPLHHVLFKHIFSIWVELVRHIFVP